MVDIKSNSAQLTPTNVNHNVNYNLPSFFLANMQSIGISGKNDKSPELAEILRQNNIDFACLTETWLSENNKNQMVFKNYNCFNLVRQNVKRVSGGVSILVKKGLITNQLNINVPEHIECIWLSFRPSKLPRSISVIIIACLYYPGHTSLYAPSQEDIAFHITETVHHISNSHSKPLFMIMGDFNDLMIDEICDTCKLNQIVTVPTRNNTTLDKILTNANNEFYNDPISLPVISGGDHFSVLYKPYAHKKAISTKKEKITIRKYKESAIIEFGAWLVNFNWNVLLRINNVNDKIDYFNNIMWGMINKLFPPIKVIISNDDKEWITPNIKRLISKRQKAHHSKNFEVRDHLAKKIKKEIKKAKKNYNRSMAETLLNLKPNAKEWYQHIAKITKSNKRSNLVLNNIPELAHKSAEEIVNLVNNHFGTVCQTYPPVDLNIATNVNQFDPDLNLISEFETYKLLKKFAKKSLGPNDFPKRILSEFAIELALPFRDITNCALKSETFPEAYKISEIVAIPKVLPPRELKDLRPISKTPVGGKILEKMILTDLEYDIKSSPSDVSQFGNTKGCSTTHYLIKATNEAFKSTDNGGATSAITIDYSKAFDLVDHTTLIKQLIKLGARNKLIKIITSFLGNRKHYTKINDNHSNLIETTCGVPQGTLSGPKFFTALIHGVNCELVSNYKFVDDKTLLHSYTGDCTPFLQNVLDIETTVTKENKMVLNESKCNIITFNFSKKNIIPQNLLLNGNPLNPVSSIKLLGVTITADLRWKENTTQICKKVNKKFHFLWNLSDVLRRTELLLKAWKVLLRPITEYASPLWHSGLSKSDSNKLESLQKRAVGIILGTSYQDHKRLYLVRGQPVPYKSALTYLNLPSLAERRESLATKFAIQTFSNERHNDFFERKSNYRPGSRYKPSIQEHTCTTERYRNASIPAMSRIINRMNCA